MTALGAFLVQLVIAIVVAVAAYLLAPKPKSAASDSTRELEAPTADAGRPIPVVFGELVVKGPNCLWYGDISHETHKVKV